MGVLFFEQRIQSHYEPLIVLTCSDSAPFVFHDGKCLVGFDIDLIRHVGRKIKRRIDLVDLPYSKLLEYLRRYPQDGSDVGIAAISPTGSLRKLMDFSVPYHTSYSALLVPVQSTITCWQDLKQATLGVRQNTIQEASVLVREANVPTEVKLIPISSITREIRERLTSGCLSGLLLSVEEAQLEAAYNPNFRAVPLPKSNNNYCIALHKRSPLTPSINKALNDLEKEGVIESLKKTWLTPKRRLFA